ncbi:blastomyces yeast-phase-specific protein [Cladorrhinum sp. PSN259]|nr:blastomyces yeast-phase-specific protein [Cladorrhinum sp. PSN259]
MLSKLTILALASTTPLVAALGRAKVVNLCPQTVYVHSVGSSVEGPYALSTNGGYYAEEFRKDPVTGGKALKITQSADGLYTGAAQTVFAYSLDGSTIWYDLSDVFGDQFNGKKVVAKSDEASCGSIVWPTGVPPAGSQVKSCTASKDVVLTLCAP